MAGGTGQSVRDVVIEAIEEVLDVGNVKLEDDLDPDAASTGAPVPTVAGGVTLAASSGQPAQEAVVVAAGAGIAEAQLPFTYRFDYRLRIKLTREGNSYRVEALIEYAQGKFVVGINHVFTKEDIITSAGRSTYVAILKPLIGEEGLEFPLTSDQIQGTINELKLQVDVSATGPAALAPSSGQQRQEAARATGKVLIVHHDDALKASAETILRSRGWQVETARTVSEAKEKLKDVDVVITSWVLRTDDVQEEDIVAGRGGKAVVRTIEAINKAERPAIVVYEVDPDLIEGVDLKDLIILPPLPDY